MCDDPLGVSSQQVGSPCHRIQNTVHKTQSGKREQRSTIEANRCDNNYVRSTPDLQQRTTPFYSASACVPLLSIASVILTTTMVDSSPPTTPKSVSFDETLNQLKEFPRIPPEEKAQIWISKSEIAQNRRKIQAETMTQQVQVLVQAKLVDMDKTHYDSLEEQARVLQSRVDQIMKLPREQILQFLETVDIPTAPAPFNWIRDGTDFWQDMPAEIQQAAHVLGYTQTSWDDNVQPEASDKIWADLSKEQQQAASILGYSPTSWDTTEVHDALPTTSTSSEEDDATPNKIQKTTGNENQNIVQAVSSHSSTDENDEKDLHGHEYVWGDLGETSDDPSEEDAHENNTKDNEDGDLDEFISNFVVDNAKEEEEAQIPKQQNHSKLLADSMPTPTQKPATDNDPNMDEFISNFLEDDTGGQAESIASQPHNKRTNNPPVKNEDANVDEFISNFLMDDTDKAKKNKAMTNSKKGFITKVEANLGAEAEFISNFLSSEMDEQRISALVQAHEKKEEGSHPKRINTFATRYVPSDDEFEFDFDNEDTEEGNMIRQRHKEQEDITTRETSPLLGADMQSNTIAFRKIDIMESNHNKLMTIFQGIIKWRAFVPISVLAFLILIKFVWF